MIKITEEIDLINFKAWSGGKDTLDDLSSSDIEKLQDVIESAYPDGMTDTQLNDLLWFERDWIAEVLDYRNVDAMFNGDSESYEEHARSVIEARFPNMPEEIVDDYLNYEFDGETDDNDAIIKEFTEYEEEWHRENDEEEEDDDD